MIYALIMFQFHPRKIVILHLIMLVIIISIIPMMFNYGNEDFMRIEYSRLSIETSFLLIPFLTLFITMDHNTPYLRPFDAYFGRSKMFFSKWLTSVLMYTYAFLIIIVIQESILTLWTHENVYNVIVSSYLRGHADGLILLTLCQMIIKDRHKTISLLIPVIWIVLSMVFDDIRSPILYYLLPIGKSVFSTYQLAYPYQLCYSVLVMILAHQKSVWETI